MRQANIGGAGIKCAPKCRCPSELSRSDLTVRTPCLALAGYKHHRQSREGKKCAPEGRCPSEPSRSDLS